MASHQKPTLSSVELIFLAKHTVGNVLRMVLDIPRLLQHVLSGTWSLKMALGVAWARSDAFSLRERYYVSPTTGDEVRRVCGRQSLPLNSVRLVVKGGAQGMPDAALHIIDLSAGRTGGGRVLFYAHGGGYVYPVMGDAQLPFQVECARAAGAHRLAVLEYTLAPELKYPGQLAQAVAALHYLLDPPQQDKQQRVRPDQIILGGDSAGGNLVAAVLAHAQKPHPDVPALQGVADEPGRRLRGALLISPWAGTSYTKPSYAENERYDIVKGAEMHWINSQWEPDAGFWADAMSAPASYWKGVPVEDVLLTGGTWEVFRDDIRQLYEAMKAGGVNVSLVEGKAEVHVQCLFDTLLALRPGVTTAKALEWLTKL